MGVWFKTTRKTTNYERKYGQCNTRNYVCMTIVETVIVC